MKTYRVIKYFTDLQDNRHAYKAGDIFPREGMTVSQDRLDELSSSNNRQHRPLIEAVESSKLTGTNKPKADEQKRDTAAQNESDDTSKAQRKPTRKRRTKNAE